MQNFLAAIGSRLHYLAIIKGIMNFNGFDRGLEAEKVITIVDQDDKTLVCVKFRGQLKPELVPVDVARLKITPMLIEFYEAHLKYDLSDQEEGNKKFKKIKPKGKKQETKNKGY